MSTNIKSKESSKDATYKFKNGKSEPFFKGREVWVRTNDNEKLIKAIVLGISEEGKISVVTCSGEERVVDEFVA